MNQHTNKEIEFDTAYCIWTFNRALQKYFSFAKESCKRALSKQVSFEEELSKKKSHLPESPAKEPYQNRSLLKKSFLKIRLI